MNVHAVAQVREKTSPSASQASLQRKCACGQRTVAGSECEACKRERLQLQRRAINQDASAAETLGLNMGSERPDNAQGADALGFEGKPASHDFSHVPIQTKRMIGEPLGRQSRREQRQARREARRASRQERREERRARRRARRAVKFEDEKPIEISLEIASETVETMPMPQNRTTVGVGEAVNLTHPVGSVAWTTTAGSLSGDIGDSVTLTAPDTTQTVTVTGGGATIGFRVIAPNDVFMERDRSTGVLHTQDRPDSGIQTQPYLRPDNVNFHNVEYRERDVAAVTTGVYAPFNGMGHLRPGKQEPKTLSKIVLPGKGTGANAFDCVQSGDPGGSAPFTPGKISYAVPYEYRVGGGPFRPFATVMQQSVLGDDGSELTSSKAGAEGDTTVASPTVTLADCPNEPPPARVAT